MGVLYAPNLLVGRHRDSNAGPHACESGVVAITLRGPPPCVTVLALLLYCLKRNKILLFAFFSAPQDCSAALQVHGGDGVTN